MIDILRDKVEECLKELPETRNSDIKLTIEVWRRYHPDLIVKDKTTLREAVWLDNLINLPREDNIKRIRAKFNAEGLYYPTDPIVRERRGIEEQKWSEAMVKEFGSKSVL